MNKIIIAVGTTSEQKIDYLKEVMKDIGIEATILSSNVESNVSGQPLTKEETTQGSINRAKSALKEHKNANIGIGIEVGYHKNKKDYEMFCCATIIDNKGRCVSAHSHFFKLPKYHQERINEGKYLAHHLDEYLKGKNNNKIKEYIDYVIRKRKPFIYEACRSAILTYFKDD
ncbi:MAG: DUF84 family protein [Nanoarchaeota archaeon]